MCGCIDCTNIKIPVGPAGATGATGAAGSNGSNGTTVLHNDISDDATKGTGLEILKTYPLPLNTLTTDGSYLEVKARFRTTYPTLMTSLKSVQMDFNGSLLNGYPFIQLTVTSVEFITIIERTSNTTAKYKVYIKDYDRNDVLVIDITSAYNSTAGLNFTTTAYDITAKANSDQAGDIICEYLTVLKYTK